MARIARLVVPTVPHHITQRGNRRQTTFFCQDDYELYIGLLAKAKVEAGVEIWAYCLMPNHVHLIVVPEHKDSLSKLFRPAHSAYSRAINARFEWRGHLWQERFYSTAMDAAHTFAAVRYVELNPVRARLCAQPEDWAWSSAKAHISNTDDSLVSLAPMLAAVEDWKSYLGIPDAREVTEAIRRAGRTGRPLGSDQFIERIEKLTGRDLKRKRPGPKPRNLQAINRFDEDCMEISRLSP